MSDRREVSGWAIGATGFASMMMFLLGGFHALAGLMAIIDDEFFVVGHKYVFKFDATTWGWIHLIFGVIIIIAGFYVLKAAVWARTVGVVLAVLSGLASFAWLPYAPVMAGLIIALAVLVIWALTSHGRDIVGG